jgi:hypothetical protein
MLDGEQRDQSKDEEAKVQDVAQLVPKDKNSLTLIQIRRWQTGGWLPFLACPRKGNRKEGRS